MQIKLLLFLLISSISTISYTQSDFLPGYYIDTLNQKIEGYINNQQWTTSPDEFYFKEKKNSKPLKIKLSESKEFQITNIVKYKRFLIPVDYSPGLESTIINSDQFFKVLIEGPKSLYQLKQFGANLFFIEIGDEISQLTNKQYQRDLGKVMINQSKVNVKDNLVTKLQLFRRELMIKLECATLNVTDFNRLKYSKSDLMGIFSKYYECSDEEVLFVDNSIKNPGFHFTPFVQYRVNSLSLSNPNNVLKDAEINGTSSVSYGIKFEYNLVVNKKRWSLIADPTFIQYKSEHLYEYNVLRDDTLMVNHTAIEIPIGIKYYITNKSLIKSYLSAQLLIDINKDSKMEFANGGTLNIRSAPGFVFSAGMTFKNIDIDFNYYAPRDLLVQSPSYRASYTAFALRVGYSLFQ